MFAVEKLACFLAVIVSAILSYNLFQNAHLVVGVLVGLLAVGFLARNHSPYTWMGLVVALMVISVLLVKLVLWIFNAPSGIALIAARWSTLIVVCVCIIFSSRNDN